VRELYWDNSPWSQLSRFPLFTYSYTSILVAYTCQIIHVSDFPLSLLQKEYCIGHHILEKNENGVFVFLPLSTLNTVTQKADQILVADMANCLNFHSEFSLGLSSAHDRQLYYKKESRRVKACTATVSIKNCYRKSLQIVKDFLDSNWGAI
jgi:transcription elongation factor